MKHARFWQALLLQTSETHYLPRSGAMLELSHCGTALNTGLGSDAAAATLEVELEAAKLMLQMVSSHVWQHVQMGHVGPMCGSM